MPPIHCDHVGSEFLDGLQLLQDEAMGRRADDTRDRLHHDRDLEALASLSHDRYSNRPPSTNVPSDSAEPRRHNTWRFRLQAGSN